MFSVTQRIKNITQPHGGYLPTKMFQRFPMFDGLTLNENENIHATLVGIAVDYLTRFMLKKNSRSAFSISLLGARRI